MPLSYVAYVYSQWRRHFFKDNILTITPDCNYSNGRWPTTYSTIFHAVSATTGAPSTQQLGLFRLKTT